MITIKHVGRSCKVGEKTIGRMNFPQTEERILPLVQGNFLMDISKKVW